MPKQVINKDEILAEALKMIREQGSESVNARSLAKFMGYSVQPIYSYFANMEELKDALYAKGLEFYNQFIYSRVDNDSILQSMAKANIWFAKEEPNLFRLLFLSKLKGLDSFADIYERMGDKNASRHLAESLKLSDDKAKQIYVMLIVFTHGIATMLVTSGANINDEEIFGILNDAYSAFILL